MSKQGTYNLIDEPWILVRFADGHLDQVSLNELFSQWESIAEILGDLSTQAFAIYRLALAIMYRSATQANSPIKEVEDWEEYWDTPDSLSEAIASYLSVWYNRFDLLDSSAPFYQVAGLRSSKNDVSTLDRIVLDSPAGGQFSNRTAAGLSRLSWAEAARWLIHIHAFDTSGIKTGAVGDPRVKGGKGYGIGTGWAGQIGGLLIRGENLFKTLMLNLIPEDLDNSPLGEINIVEDLPPWERAPLGAGVRDGNENLNPTGPVDLYTWQSRRVRLVGDADGATGVVLAQGDRMTPQNRQKVEPMTVWRYSLPQSKKFKMHVYMPRLHDSSRSLWRGLGAVIPQLSSAQSTDGFDKKTKVQSSFPPAVLTWQAYLVNQYIIDPESLVPIETYGLEYGAQSAVVDNSLHDSLTLPSRLLADSGKSARANLVKALEAAEETANVVGRFARNLAVASGASETDGEYTTIRTRFFFQAETAFRHWIVEPELDDQNAVVSWQRQLSSLANQLFSELVATVPASAAIGHAGFGGRWMDLGEAEVTARRALRRALPDAFAPAQQSLTTTE